MGSGQDLERDPQAPPSPDRRRCLRDLERYRRQARRLEEDPAYGTYLASQGLTPSGAEPSSPLPPRPEPRGIGRLWRWFLSHL